MILWHPEPDLAFLGPAEVAKVKAMALDSPLKRARICLHRSHGDPIQEMVVALRRGCYIPPHRHGGRSESLHVMEGALLALFFDETGKATRRERLDASGQVLYRLASDRWHTVAALADMVVFHEVVQGPFEGGVELAPWAPAQGDEAAARAFLDRLTQGVGS